MGVAWLAIGILVGSPIRAVPQSVETAQRSSEERAIRYLAAEVRAWPINNRCFSCHNNGDAARVLYTAMHSGRAVPAENLSHTTSWLLQPATWNDADPNPAIQDKVLATLQFSFALTAARSADVIRESRELADAAAELRRFQAEDGAWRIDAAQRVGSPAVYGTALATAIASRILEQSNDEVHADSIRRARAWIRKNEPASVLEAAAAILALPETETVKAAAVVKRAQNSDGGWGPYLHTPSEAFDTALALIALSHRGGSHSTASVARGRAYLVSTQLPEGGWPATTRPPGGESYAQHISTSAWALEALLRTNPKAQ